MENISGRFIINLFMKNVPKYEKKDIQNISFLKELEEMQEFPNYLERK